jgi:hypothetical protein
MTITNCSVTRTAPLAEQEAGKAVRPPRRSVVNFIGGGAIRR